MYISSNKSIYFALIECDRTNCCCEWRKTNKCNYRMHLNFTHWFYSPNTLCSAKPCLVVSTCFVRSNKKEQHSMVTVPWLKHNIWFIDSTFLLFSMLSDAATVNVKLVSIMQEIQWQQPVYLKSNACKMYNVIYGHMRFSLIFFIFASPNKR